MNTDKKFESDKQNTIKTAFLNTFTNAVSLVIGMIMVPVISRVFLLEELGIATTFLSTRNILVIIVTLAVYSYVNRAMIDLQGKTEKKDYLFTITLFSLFMTAAFFLLLIPFQDKVKTYLTLDTFLYHWLFFSIPSFALYTIAYYYCLFHNKSKTVFIIVLCSGPLSQILSVGLAGLFPFRKSWWRVLGLDSTYMVTSVLFLLWLIFSGKRRFRTEHLRQTIAFTIPIIPHLLSQMVLTQCDLIMISTLTSSDRSGLYSMGHTVGFLAFTVMSQIMASWSPWVYRTIKEGKETVIYTNARLIFLLGAYLSIGLLTISTELVHLFLSSSYSPCIYIIPPLTLSMFFQFCYIFMYDLEYYYKKTKWIAVCSLFAAVLNLMLNYMFIPLYGYLAAGYTTMASYLTLLLTNYFCVRKLHVSKIYPLGYFFKTGCLVIGYTIFSMLFQENILMRYGVFLFITAMIVRHDWPLLNKLLRQVLNKKN